jgi:eukaryotic-like serine/threonine-protein kinase
MMFDLDDARILEAEQVFDAVVDLPAVHRAAALAERCGEDVELRTFVERLLRSHERCAGSDDSRVRLRATPDRPPPERIGRFRIVRVLGEGGMGTVYEAEQDHPKRTVALKVMRRGVTSRSALRRFEHESQILARLHHPGIAQVYEVGVHDDGGGGVPYFAMEHLSNAMPITEHTASAALDRRERLQLFATVCDAVHHGHQKGVIHRDLKPANILVDSAGSAKVIDFGVARATDADMAVTTMQTDFGQLVGTLQYMSPEQTQADPHNVDVRSDVYSLGVVLYELVCGRPPYDVTGAPIVEAARMVRDEPPARPTTIDRALGGDVETIILKALEKDRERRYQSAAELAADMRRYLADQPIAARPPSAAYQVRTFARRNKALVGGVAATFVVLALGLAGTSGMYLRAERQRMIAEANEARAVEEADRAEREANRALEHAAEADQVAGFQARQLSGINAALMGTRLRETILANRQAALQHAGQDDEKIQLLLHEFERHLDGVNLTSVALESLDENIFQRAITAIDEEFADRPLIQARLLHTVGNTLRNVGLFDRALAPQERAVEIRRCELGDEDPLTLASLTTLARILNDHGRHADAERICREVLEVDRKRFGDDHRYTLGSLRLVGLTLAQQGRQAEAAQIYAEVYERARRLPDIGEDDLLTLSAANDLGWSLSYRGRYAEAETILHDAVDRLRRIGGDEHVRTLETMIALGSGLRLQGRLDDAERLMLEVVEACRRTDGDGGGLTLSAAATLSEILRDQGRFAEAECWLRLHAEHTLREAWSNHHAAPRTLYLWARLKQDQGRLAEAEEDYRAALDWLRRIRPMEGYLILDIVSRLGLVRLERGDLEEAEELMQEAIEKMRTNLGEYHPDVTLAAAHRMGLLRLAQGRLEEAEHTLGEALAARLELFGEGHWETLHSMSDLGSAMRAMGRLEEAERLGAEAVRGARAALPHGHWRLGAVLTEYGRTLATTGRGDEAAAAIAEALSIFEAALESGHHLTQAMTEALAAVRDR